MDSILRTLQAQQGEMVKMLRRLVEAESPSTDKAAVDHFGAMIGGIARRMQARVRVFPSRQTGNHLRAEFRLGPVRTSGQILLLGHMDTVWDCGTIARMPFRVRQGRVYGPGVFDMKSGIVAALFALRALRTLRIPVKKKVVLLLTSDEETGSLASRPLTEREARRSDCVLVMEPAHGLKGALKTSRKGVGEFEIQIKGRAAHAGLDPGKGASAIEELARQVLRVKQFADRRRGITVNVGVISGGTRSNVVAAEASAVVDVRVARIRDQREIERKIRSLQPADRRTSMKVSSGKNRPPLKRTRQVAQLFQRARALARPLGIELLEAAVGGGSDGNFTAALGVPTLDGLGGVGEGAHAPHENILLRELPRRAALLAHLIASL